MIDELREDARLFHRLRHPDREPTRWSLALLAVRSRGLLVLGGYRWVKAALRDANAGSSAPLRRRAVRAFANVLYYVVRILSRSEIRIASELAPGVYVSDRGNVMLGARMVGAGTVIHHRVTVGRSLKGAGEPEIGERVWIGPDCVVAGDIRVGDGATILPGTVLTRSIPTNTAVQGNPARIVSRAYDNAALRRTLITDPIPPPPSAGATP